MNTTVNYFEFNTLIINVLYFSANIFEFEYHQQHVVLYRPYIEGYLRNVFYVFFTLFFCIF